MKKLLAVLLCAALALSLAGCAIIGGMVEGITDRLNGTGKTPAPGETGGAGPANPMQPVLSAAAFRELGIDMAAPEGAQNVAYYIVGGNLAQASFTLDGFDYTYRASKAETDISGVYDTFSDAFCADYEADGAAFTAAAQNASSGGRLVTWSVNGVNYSLWCPLAPDDAQLSACLTGALEKSFASVRALVSPAAEPLDFYEAGTLEMDLNGDGLIERVGFEESYDEYDFLEVVTIRIVSGDGSEVNAQMEMMGYLSGALAYDIDGDGLVELFISGDVCSSDYETWMFRYDAGALIAGNPAYIPEYDYGYVLPCVFGSVEKIEGNVLTISNVVDILGSWWCETQYQLSGSGFGLERVPGSVWTYDSSDYNAEAWEWAAVTAAEFPVTLEGASAPATLPVGTHLVPLDTDGETYMRFITQDGATGTIRLARNADPYGWGFVIDGVPEDELFSNLPYAG